MKNNDIYFVQIGDRNRGYDNELQEVFFDVEGAVKYYWKQCHRWQYVRLVTIDNIVMAEK